MCSCWRLYALISHYKPFQYVTQILNTIFTRKPLWAALMEVFVSLPRCRSPPSALKDPIFQPDFIKRKEIAMSAEMKKYVKELLETYHDRERMIAVLRYELEHPGKISGAEQIEAMTYGHGDGIGGTKGHISNKTLYIALNYEEQTERLNATATKEIAEELFDLEQRQKKLLYYIALLGKRQADVLRLIYIEKLSTKEVVERYGLTYRTIDRIKKEAVESLAEMYTYSERYNG